MQSFINIPKNFNISIMSNKLILQSNNKINYIHINMDNIITIKQTAIVIESNSLNSLNTQKNLILQSIIGLTRGFKIKLNLIGIGYKHFIHLNKLYFKLNKSHLIYFTIPSNLIIYSLSATIIILNSDSLSTLTNFKKNLVNIIKPNVYKKKGIFFYNENIIIKKKK